MSELIKSRREELGLTQAQLGGLIDSSATGIAAMERQEASGEIKAKTLRMVLAALGVELMLTTVEVERPNRLVMAETAARKTTDRTLGRWACRANLYLKTQLSVFIRRI